MSREIGIEGSETAYADQLQTTELLGAQVDEETRLAAMVRLVERVMLICEGAEVTMVGIAYLALFKDRSGGKHNKIRRTKYCQCCGASLSKEIGYIQNQGIIIARTQRR